MYPDHEMIVQLAKPTPKSQYSITTYVSPGCLLPLLLDEFTSQCFFQTAFKGFEMIKRKDLKSKREEQRKILAKRIANNPSNTSSLILKVIAVCRFVHSVQHGAMSTDLSNNTT